MKLINKVKDTIEKYKMIQEKDRVLVAVSGGPDSICLLHILLRLREVFNIEISVAHINHLIRGDSSDEDAKYVENFCREHNLEFFLLRKKVEEYARRNKLSSEMAGREVRYDFFYEIKRKKSIDKIAIAHNLNDNAETIMMRIMRGTGIEGLQGIKPVRNDIFIRPLIESSRNEIEEYCKAFKLNPRIDKTNLETIYSRNKIRLQLIPYIEENFNSDIISTLNRFSHTMSIDNDYLNGKSEEYFKTYCSIYKDKIILKKEIFEKHEAIISRVIRKAIYLLKSNIYNFEKKHISDIILLQKNSTGKQINLTDNIIAYNEYGNILLIRKLNKKNISKWEYNIAKEGNIYIVDLNINVETSIISRKNVLDYHDAKVKFFDYDKIKNSITRITIRNRRDGDSFTPFGMKGRKKLKDYFINEKIPKEDRDKIPILCFDDEIAWIVGFRVSNKFAITKDTKKILKIHIKDGSFNEG